MKKGRPGTTTHDYIRNGTSTPFAALNVLNGTVIGPCMARTGIMTGAGLVVDGGITAQ